MCIYREKDRETERERKEQQAGRACISAMSLRLAALLLRSRDSPYKGMGNEVKRGEKASVPNRLIISTSGNATSPKKARLDR